MFTFRFPRLVACAALLLAATPASAQDWFPGEFSANVGFATDYPFRGISQTNENAAIQGGIDWSAEITEGVSIYAGGWGSNVDFGDGDEAQVEIDIYGGFSGEIGNFSWDVMTLYYEYPGAKSSLDYDFIEFGPTFGYDFGVASVSLNYMWSPDYFGGSGDSHWISGGVEVPVPESVLPDWLGITASGELSHQAIDDESTFGVRDYATWNLGATFSAFGLDLDLRYHDTDLARDSCFGGGRSSGDLCDARAVALISKSF